jgi:hypothetical protein
MAERYFPYKPVSNSGNVKADVSAFDRMVFKKHPGMTRFYRPIVEGEFPIPNLEGCNAVQVVQFAEGFRKRAGCHLLYNDWDNPGWVIEPGEEYAEG